MAISHKDIKILWSASGGRCAFPECWEKLTFSSASTEVPHTIGEMAHICGDRPGSNRYEVAQSSSERDSYENLVLLWPTHHRTIDRKENEIKYSVGMLRDMKREHELRILELTELPDAVDKIAISAQVLIFLEENRQVWEMYGPVSDLARKNPNDDAAYALWRAERLSTIVPNNRKMRNIIESHRDVYEPADQNCISQFLLHVRSYEDWVNDKIEYRLVKRFPSEFDDMIKSGANAIS